MSLKKITFLAAFVLVALFAPNNAKAYYNPSTGRWLARDPVGEPGFETLRAAYPTPQVGQVASTASLPPSRLFVRDAVAAKKEPNRYAFVSNKPVITIDKLGLSYGNPVSGPSGPVGPADPYASGSPYYPDGPYYVPSSPPDLPPGYVEGEAHFIIGSGFTRVSCCDENGTKRIFWYRKICIGGAIGFGGGGGAVVSGMSGKNCRGSNYEGWFYEAGGSLGPWSAGGDIGYTSGGDFSGVNEVGGGLGQGLPGIMFKSTWCYYSLFYEKDIPCGCGK